MGRRVHRHIRENCSLEPNREYGSDWALKDSFKHHVNSTLSWRPILLRLLEVMHSKHVGMSTIYIIISINDTSFPCD